MPKLISEWQRSHILDAIFDNISDALILYDRDNLITGVNRAAERLFGISSEAMVGRNCRDVFRCSECEPGCGVLVGLNEAPTVSNATVTLHTGDGLERMAVMTTKHIYDEAGQLQGALATIRDVTEAVEPQKREVIAESAPMREVMRFVKRVAASETTTILLEGENGVGKDLIAKTIHYLSIRQAEPFIAINCAAIPETLLESELFGYEKGAFTDARSQKRGIFELADRGTLFLDEIGEIPLTLQAKLLRVLEEQTFRRVGGLKDIRVDIRVIAATNKNLREAVREGAFRQDLYFRLNVIQIVIPPLRERPEDIIPMAHFFVEHYNKKFRRNTEGISDEAMRLMSAHDWPGNVRELRNAIERAMILEEGPTITSGSLPLAIKQHHFEESNGNQNSAAAVVAAAIDFSIENMSLEEHERMMVTRALEKTNGNQTQAARLLSITRDTLRYKMKKFNLR